MGTREDLDALLTETLGSESVYYQPPENLQMIYPCIVYSQDKPYVRHANNKTYHRRKAYKLLYISYDSDEEVVDKLADLPYCSMGEPYTTDNLYHYPYTIYF
jgi:hypothetical protein